MISTSTNASSNFFTIRICSAERRPHWNYTIWRSGSMVHREDGPAMVYDNGKVRWFHLDVECNLDEYMKRMGFSEHEKIMFKLRWGGR